MNHNGNYILSLYAAIEKFAVVSMESEHADPMQSEEYQIINALIVEFLKRHNVLTCKYQFKIQVETLEQKEDVILSPELEAAFS